VACTASELAHWHGMSQKSVQPATEAADVMQGIYSWLVSVMKGMKRLKRVGLTAQTGISSVAGQSGNWAWLVATKRAPARK